MLCCRDVTIRQGEKVLWQNLTFSLHPGERIGICAPSGTGKTTLGRVLAGWQKPTSGDILVDEQPLPMHKYCPVQLVPQHPELTFNPDAAPVMRFMMPGDRMLKCLPVFTSTQSG